ncbi:MAG: response regulator transcription factor [Anaerolineae bacterium]
MNILIVDDDQALVDVLQRGLGEDGYHVIAASNGRDAIAAARTAKPDLVILDVMMPEMDGWECCRHLRDFTDVPIIYLTVRGSEADIVRGLAYGADDFLTKPFSLAELKARAESILRRAGNRVEQEVALVYDDGELRIDLQRSAVHKRNEEVTLSPTEFRLLTHLVRNEGLTVPHSDLLREVWGPGYAYEMGYLALYVHYLRRKIEDDPSKPKYIRTRARVGYYFAGQVEKTT